MLKKVYDCCMRKIITVLAMMLISSTVNAEWLCLEEFSNKDCKIYIDSEIEVGLNSDKYVVWLQYKFAEPQIFMDYEYQKVRDCMVFDGSCMQYGRATSILYDWEDKLVKKYTYENPKMEYPTPNTLMSTVKSLVKSALKDGTTTIELDEDSDTVREPSYNTIKQGHNVQSNRSYQSTTLDKANATDIQIKRGCYYLANVTANKLLVRNGPGVDYPAAGSLAKGQKVIVDGTDYLKGGFCLVVGIDGDLYGYVSSRYIQVCEEIDQNFGGVLDEAGKFVDERNECRINIKNDVNVAITVEINGVPYKIQSGESIMITGVKAGKINILATAKGFYPYHGIDNAKGGYIYDWVFYEKK